MLIWHVRRAVAQHWSGYMCINGICTCIRHLSDVIRHKLGELDEAIVVVSYWSCTWDRWVPRDSPNSANMFKRRTCKD